MKKILFIISLAAILLAVLTPIQAKTKVACVGNSITANAALAEKDRYPSILQTLLGTQDYEVRNYGLGGRTLLKKGNSPYWNEAKYVEVKNWNPDIVIIKLGTNDAKPANWKYKSEFVDNYVEFINSFKSLASKPQIFVCYPLPAFSGNTLSIDNATIVDEMIPMIKSIAEQTQSTIIDLHTALQNKPEFTYDKIHPNIKGTTFMAHTIYPYICPQCEAKPLVDDFWAKITSFDYTDKFASLTSSFSIEEDDFKKLIDNDPLTSISVPFSESGWFSVEIADPFRITGYSITPVKSEGKTVRSRGSCKHQLQATIGKILTFAMI